METSVNVIVVEGIVVNDPALHYNAEGLAVTKFEVTVSQKIGICQDEEIIEDSKWLVKTNGKLAEVCATYLKPGSRVIVSGRLGKSKACPDGIIRASDVKFLPAKRRST